MIIEKEIISEAKKKLGDEAARIIAKDLELENFDEKNLKANCYFHQEKTPSMIWDSKRQTYHCFSCGKNYNILEHFMEYNGLTFLESVQKLFELTNTKYKFAEMGIKSKKNYRYPIREENNNRDKVEEYLALRKISKKTLDYCDIQQDNNGNIAFHYYDENDVLSLVKYRPARKIDKEKGDIKAWSQKNADHLPLLFNMNRIDPTRPLVITEGECFDENTEILTPNGWIKLSNYQGELVMQVDENMNGSFIKPLAYINKEYNGDMYTFQHRNGYMSCTKNHNICYFDYKNRLQKVKICDMPKSIGRGYIPTAIEYNGNGIQLTENQIALYLAICADCTIDIRKTKRRCRFGANKKRKIDRLIYLLEQLNIDYYYTPSVISKPGFSYIGFDTPDWIIDKRIPKEWIYLATKEQKKFILKELLNWDGNHVNNRTMTEYSSKNLDDVQIIQTIAHISGINSTIIKRKNQHGEWYKCTLLNNKNGFSWQNSDKYLNIENVNKRVYCVNVPTGMILIKQNNKINVCGNCDTLSIIEAGYPNVVSVPFGSQSSSNWIDYNWDWLQQFESIIIWSDYDEAGIKMRQDVCPRLGNWRTLYIDLSTLQEEKKVKDANEVLYYFGKEKILELIQNANESPLEDFIDIDDVKSFDLENEQGIYTGLKEIDEALNKLYFGNLVIWTGKRGNGKTVIANQIAISEPLNQGYNVAAFSLELPNPMLKSWVDRNIAGRERIVMKNEKIPTIDAKTMGEIKNWRQSRCFLYNNEINKNYKHILNRIEEIVRRKGVKSILLDNFMMVDLEAHNSDKYDKQIEFIKELVILSRKLYCIIHLVAHPRKTGEGELQNDDISGSGHITDLAQYVFAIKRFKDEDKQGVMNLKTGEYYKGKEPHNYDLSATILKNRITGEQDKTVMLHFDYPSYRIYDTTEMLWKRYKWNKDNSPLPNYDPKDNNDEIFGKINT